ncbi:MAG: flagellar filament capping protein FliD [Aquabacterium sp.]
MGSTAKVDGVDLQLVVNPATAFARPAVANAHTHETEQKTEISSAGRLKSTAAATLDAAERLTRPQTWSATKATSSDESLVQAVSDQAKPGRYRVEVEATAMAQTTASATFSSLSTVIGIGTLKIELGSWNASQSTFATNPNWPKANVSTGPKDTSLERIRDKINAAGIGVIASVVSDATGSRLVLRSTSTGSTNGFKVETEGEQGMAPEAAEALAALGFDPSKVQGSGSELLQPAQDAEVRIDGRTLKSAQNLLEDEKTGLSLRVKGNTRKPVDIQVEPDTDAMRRDVQAFAVTYNELSRQLSAYDGQAADEDTQAARDIRTRVQAAFRPESAADARGTTRLADIGIRMNPAGQLEVDPDRLSQALRTQPKEVRELMAGDPQQATSRMNGLASRLADIRLAEAPAGTASSRASAEPQEPAQTAAGTLFRQKLLERYAPAEEAEAGEPSRHDGELAIQANEA